EYARICSISVNCKGSCIDPQFNRFVACDIYSHTSDTEIVCKPIKGKSSTNLTWALYRDIVLYSSLGIGSRVWLIGSRGCIHMPDSFIIRIPDACCILLSRRDSCIIKVDIEDCIYSMGKSRNAHPHFYLASYRIVALYLMIKLCRLCTVNKDNIKS